MRMDAKPLRIFAFSVVGIGSILAIFTFGNGGINNWFVILITDTFFIATSIFTFFLAYRLIKNEVVENYQIKLIGGCLLIFLALVTLLRGIDNSFLTNSLIFIAAYFIGGCVFIYLGWQDLQSREIGR